MAATLLLMMMVMTSPTRSFSLSSSSSFVKCKRRRKMKKREREREVRDAEPTTPAHRRQERGEREICVSVCTRSILPSSLDRYARRKELIHTL